MRALIIAAVVAASPATASVTVENCTVEEVAGSSTVYCDVSNMTDTPIAMMQYVQSVRDQDRTVPWSVQGNGPPRWASVSGGIEPDETINVMFGGFYTPDHADFDNLAINVEITTILDVNDQPIH